MRPTTLDKLGAFAALLLGLLAFLLVVGPRVLDPTNLAWLQGGDPSTHYLGWHFYRQAEWSFPLGLNPDYGLEFANAIVYSDSLPLFAFLFKPFDAWLPQPFQYFGLWLLVCFLLQALFAWKLTGLITARPLPRLLACGLFVFAPPLLYRLNGHWSLVGHFLLLAALYLTLRPGQQRRVPAWALLLGVVALVHPYFLAMTGLLWLADLGGRTHAGALRPAAATKEALGLLLLVGVLCWQAGYFSVGRGLVGSEWFGHFNLNLLSLIDASGWSFFLRDIPEGEGDYEGFNFLGFGVILLAVSSLPLLPRQLPAAWRALRQRPFLLLALLGLTAFALSNRLGFGPFELSYPLPYVLLRASELFRASGRMFWPVFYCLLLLIVYVVLRGNGRRAACWLLGAALLIQIADTRLGWGTVRPTLMAERRPTLLESTPSPFWAEAARRYTQLRWLPPTNVGPQWAQIAWLAGSQGMGTDAVYLARLDVDDYYAAIDRGKALLSAGDFADEALYVLDASVVEEARRSMDPAHDLLLEVDGLTVLAPGWFD